MMIILLAVGLFFAGAVCHCRILRASAAGSRLPLRILFALFSASSLAISTAILMGEFLSLPISFWTAIATTPVFFLFTDSLSSALRFYAEDSKH
ncbi:hypothetical protein C7H09_11645 [Marinobacter fuscus]|uniref:Uncharacterized protein n=1 Tax=Marinobacter fuscus TaxID=2109942 RepID=A0A2T1K755_9GAMM|nr:hypothetical protein C7H09_11645 [Marinobacter fuscus]